MSRWPMVKLGEVCECLDKLRRPVKESERIPGQIPYYGANGQQGWIHEAIFDEDLVLVAEDGGHFDNPQRGVAYKISGPAWVNNHAHVLRAKDEIDVDFLHYSLRNYDFSRVISGTTRKKLNQKQMLEVVIPLPPLNEQKRIAEILGGVAETLELLQKQIDWVERVLKSNLQDDTEKTQEVLLSDFVTRISAGKSMPDGDMKKPKYQVLKTSAVTSGFFKETEAKGLPEGYIPPLTHKVHAGDILVSRMNTTELVGASAIVESVSENIYLPDRLWKLHPVEGTDPFFLWQLLQTRLIRARISQVSSGSSGSMKNISQKAFLNIKVPFASSSEQSKISKTIRSLLHLRQLLHQKLTLLQELQRSLSARAFAGQL